MLNVRRITVVTPQFSDPLLNQEISISHKIKSMGLMGAGNCSYTCKFEKDVLYPNEVIKLEVGGDGTGLRRNQFCDGLQRMFHHLVVATLPVSRPIRRDLTEDNLGILSGVSHRGIEHQGVR